MPQIAIHCRLVVINPPTRAGFHSSGSPALRKPSNTGGRFGVCAIIHFTVSLGLRRRASVFGQRTNDGFALPGPACFGTIGDTTAISRGTAAHDVKLPFAMMAIPLLLERSQVDRRARHHRCDRDPDRHRRTDRHRRRLSARVEGQRPVLHQDVVDFFANPPTGHDRARLPHHRRRPWPHRGAQPCCLPQGRLASRTAATLTNRVSRSGDDRHGRKPRRRDALVTLLCRSGFSTVLVGKQGRTSKSRDQRLRKLDDALFGHAADHHIAQPIARP